jgi:nucleotide-binding universal stress UspA family protein
MKAKSLDNRSPRVLCGTDFSPAAAQAVDVAACLAKKWNLPLELAHVSVVPAEPTVVKKLKAAVSPLRARGVVVRDVMLEGSPDEELVKRAKPKSCRLVVVSSLGKRTVRRWLLGSVSQRTAQRASVPTLVVRDSAPFEAWTRGERPLRIFVAFNFTATSEAALAWVETLRSIGPCEVTVGYVDFPLEQKKRLGGSLPFGSDGNPPEIQEILERDLKARVKELLGASDFRLRVVPDWGPPDVPLANLASAEKADLIVVGSHQYRGFERLWHLSVSSGLLHSAAMSVAVVPLTTKKARTTGIAPPLRRVLVATDFSVLANHAIARAYSLLRGGGTLHLVHVIHPHELAGGEFLRGTVNQAFLARHAKYKETCMRRLRALIPAESVVLGIHTVLEVVEHAEPAKGICEAAERCAADAICTGTHGFSGLSKTMLGSVSRKVLEQSSRPLMLVHPPAET